MMNDTSYFSGFNISLMTNQMWNRVVLMNP